MNLLMDSLQHHGSPTRRTPPQHAELRISTTPPTQQVAPNQNQNQNHNNNNNNNNNETPPVKTTLKRSFDVAFLMMPDERIKQKQAEKQARLQEALHQQTLQMQPLPYATDLSPRAAAAAAGQPASPAAGEYINLLEARQRYPQLSIRSPRIYDDPTLIIPILDSPESVVSGTPMRSAFTKVSASASSSSNSTASSTTSRLESPLPAPLSPDQLSCHSLSPPLATPPPPPRTNSGGSGGAGPGAVPAVNGPPSLLVNALPPNPIVYHNFRPDYQFNGAAFQAVSPMQALQAQQRLKQQLLYRPASGGVGNPGVNGSTSPANAMGNAAPPPAEFLHAAYTGFPFPGNAAGAAAGAASMNHGGHPFGPAPELPRIVQNPAAAAILSTLIPPTLASTFTLTAQNVCAKCNISFRMTSDLVYHMRSHHKSEVACDPNRRKREEKLRCPVCQETFRERHHLTRHMTAHQDKASDHQPTPSDDSNDNEIINVVSGGATPPGAGAGAGAGAHRRVGNLSK